MTKEEREEATDFLKGYLDEEVYTEKCRNAHKMAIKALEQESILDKVKTEIESLERFEIRGEKTSLVNVDRVLDIIDKYKAEDKGLDEINNDLEPEEEYEQE